MGAHACCHRLQERKQSAQERSHEDREKNDDLHSARSNKSARTANHQEPHCDEVGPTLI